MEEVDLGEDKGPMILHLINVFLNSYSDKIEGRFVKEIAVECQGGSRINYIFHEIFNKVINGIDPFEYLTDRDIQCAIKNSSALNPSLFVPEGAFEVLIRQQIARLLEPSIDCAHEVYEELRYIVINIQIPGLQRYYRLQSKICDVMEEVLDQCLSPTTEMITGIIEIENAHININHPDFVGGSDSLLNLFQIDGEDSSHTLLTESGKPSIYERQDSGIGEGTTVIDEGPDQQAEADNNSSWIGSLMGGSNKRGGKKTDKGQGKQQNTTNDKSDTMSISVFSQVERESEPMVKNHMKRFQDEQEAKK